VPRKAGGVLIGSSRIETFLCRLPGAKFTFRTLPKIQDLLCHLSLLPDFSLCLCPFLPWCPSSILSNLSRSERRHCSEMDFLKLHRTAKPSSQYSYFPFSDCFSSSSRANVTYPEGRECCIFTLNFDISVKLSWKSGEATEEPFIDDSPESTFFPARKYPDWSLSMMLQCHIIEFPHPSFFQNVVLQIHILAWRLSYTFHLQSHLHLDQHNYIFHLFLIRYRYLPLAVVPIAFKCF